jgi:hypothetical protein
MRKGDTFGNDTAREPPRPWVQSAHERGGAARLFLVYRTAGAEERKVVMFNRSLQIPPSAMGNSSQRPHWRADFPYFGDRMRPPNKPSPQWCWPPKRNRFGSDHLFWHSIESEIQLRHRSTILIDSFVISGCGRQPNSSTSSKMSGGFPSGFTRNGNA